MSYNDEEIDSQPEGDFDGSNPLNDEFLDDDLGLEAEEVALDLVDDEEEEETF
jgi:hypothetical protein